MALHVILVLTVIGLLAACGGGGSGATSGATVPAGSPVPLISDETLADSYAAFGEVADKAAAGDLDGAEETFFRQAHDITHVIDFELLETPEHEAVRLALYDSVFDIEVELLGQRRPDVVASAAEASQAALADAAVALGYQRPQ
jgi:hypothetical protein